MVGQSAFAGPLAAYRDVNRLIVISLPAGTTVEKVSAMLNLNRAEMDERQLKLIDVSEGSPRITSAVRLTPEQTGFLRRQLKIDVVEARPTFILLGKDGGEKARCHGTLDLRKWFTLIDQMPMRRAEIQEQKRQGPEPTKN